MEGRLTKREKKRQDREDTLMALNSTPSHGFAPIGNSILMAKIKEHGIKYDSLYDKWL